MLSANFKFTLGPDLRKTVIVALMKRSVIKVYLKLEV